MHPRLRGNYSSVNILANRSNLTTTFVQDAQDADYPKRVIFRSAQEQSFTIVKPRKNQDMADDEGPPSQVSQEDKKSAYFFRQLTRKNRLRNELNINIHNSIYTFKEFMKACQLSQPKPIDTRIPM